MWLYLSGCGLSLSAVRNFAQLLDDKPSVNEEIVVGSIDEAVAMHSQCSVEVIRERAQATS